MADIKNLQNFYQQLFDYGAKLQHQFQLRIDSTNIPGVDKLFEDVTMWCSGVNLPGRTQNSAPAWYLGFSFPIPTNFAMTQNITFDIVCDSDMRIRDAMLAWAAYVSDPDIPGGSAGGGRKAFGTATGRIDLLDEQMATILHTYELYGMYPQNIGDAVFTNQNAGIVTFPATFNFAYWKLVKSPNSLPRLS